MLCQDHRTQRNKRKFNLRTTVFWNLGFKSGRIRQTVKHTLNLPIAQTVAVMTNNVERFTVKIKTDTSMITSFDDDHNVTHVDKVSFLSNLKIYYEKDCFVGTYVRYESDADAEELAKKLIEKGNPDDPRFQLINLFPEIKGEVTKAIDYAMSYANKVGNPDDSIESKKILKAIDDSYKAHHH